MHKRILIIDDDMGFVQFVKRHLDLDKYHVESAETMNEGLKKAKSFSPNLILLDIINPGKDKKFREIKDLRNNESLKHIPIVLVTDIRKEFNLPFGLEPDETYLPVTAVLEKPVQPDVLISTIENIVK
jgi:CheY-like chemotaxis protein